LDAEKEDCPFGALLGKVYEEKVYLTLLTMVTIKLTKDIRFSSFSLCTNPAGHS